jgi:hypothetical protein
VSLAAFMRGRLSRRDLIPYWVAQLVAALIAAVLARFVVNPRSVTALSLHGRGIAAALLAEFLFTFALAYVVLNVATSKDHPGQLVLRAGDRLHGLRRRRRRRRHQRRRVQSRGRPGRLRDGPVFMVRHLDLPGGRPRGRRSPP